MMLQEKFQNNFFIQQEIVREYKNATEAIKKASMPPKKKIYRNLNKMLQEGFLVGSLKYGNNFIC